MKADLTIDGITYRVKTEAFEDVIACTKCGEPMEFISVELGYSCSNVDCILHLESVRV